MLYSLFSPSKSMTIWLPASVGIIFFLSHLRRLWWLQLRAQVRGFFISSCSEQKKHWGIAWHDIDLVFRGTLHSLLPLFDIFTGDGRAYR